MDIGGGRSSPYTVYKPPSNSHLGIDGLQRMLQSCRRRNCKHAAGLNFLSDYLFVEISGLANTALPPPPAPQKTLISPSSLTPWHDAVAASQCWYGGACGPPCWTGYRGAPSHGVQQRLLPPLRVAPP